MADLAGAYADARRRLQQLVAGLDDTGLMAPVPACPDWTVRDIVAHLAGIAEEVVSGTYFAGAADAWNDAGLAAQRDQWTASQVRSDATAPCRSCSPNGPTRRRPWSRYSPAPSHGRRVHPLGCPQRQWPTWRSISMTCAAPSACQATETPPRPDWACESTPAGWASGSTRPACPALRLRAGEPSG